jgi:hypothetical protein
MPMLLLKLKLLHLPETLLPSPEKGITQMLSWVQRTKTVRDIPGCSATMDEDLAHTSSDTKRLRS